MAMTSDVRVRAFPGMPVGVLEILQTGDLLMVLPDWQRRLTRAWEDSALTGDARLKHAWAEVLNAIDAATRPDKEFIG